jgi:adenosylcobinamide-GDP ribazoletransferase
MHPFFIALQFLTRLPLNIAGEWKAESVGKSLLYYPLVGLIIGLILMLAANLIGNDHTLVAAAILLLLWVMITGGLHLDGLADSADAWAGGLGDKERTLEIMKDPRAGPMAIVVLLLVLLVKFSVLNSIVEKESWQLLVVAPVLARGLVILLFITTPYVRANGLGADMARFLPEKAAYIVMAITAMCLLFVLGFWQSIVTVAVSLFSLYALRLVMMKRIQGMTGDTIGASVEITEVAVLLSLVVL